MGRIRKVGGGERTCLKDSGQKYIKARRYPLSNGLQQQHPQLFKSTVTGEVNCPHLGREPTHVTRESISCLHGAMFQAIWPQGNPAHPSQAFCCRSTRTTLHRKTIASESVPVLGPGPGVSRFLASYSMNWKKTSHELPSSKEIIKR